MGWHQSRRDLYDAQGGLCYLCGKHMRRSPARKKHQNDAFTLDHVFPKALGGTAKDGVLLAHPKCNVARGDTPPTAAQLEYLKIVRERLHNLR